MPKRTQFNLGSIESDILRHLTARDFLISFFLSGRSTRVFYREAYKRAHLRYRYKRSITGLQKKGFLKRRGEVLSLTAQGRKFMEILASRTASDETEWKGHWWIVMYDIPIKVNSFRFELRGILIHAGFKKLQHSVWIYPHQCKELELFLESHRSLLTYVRYFEALPFVGMETLGDWKKLPLT